MKTTIILASAFAAFSAAAPFELAPTRSISVRVARSNPTPVFYTPSGFPQPTPGLNDVPSDEPAFVLDPIETEPIEIAPVEARQASSVRVLLAFDREDTAVQANIPRNGQRINIRAKFAALGNPLLANRGNIVSGGGSCRIFRDAAATQQVGVLQANGNSVSFGGNVNLQNGVIVCN